MLIGWEWKDTKTNEIKYFNSIVALSVVNLNTLAPSPDSSAGSFGADDSDDLPFLGNLIVNQSISSKQKQ